MSALFRHFGAPGSGWTLHVHTFAPKLGSALCPFAFIAVRNAPDAAVPTGFAPIFTHFSAGAGSDGAAAAATAAGAAGATSSGAS